MPSRQQSRPDAILVQMKPNPSETTDCALRTLLGQLLTTIKSSAEKVLVGNDPDDIHDLRVATRRTRTILGQVPGGFPKNVINPYRRGFKNIGIVTGDCRDLDVWIDAIGEDRSASKGMNAIPLGPLENLISHQRDTAREIVNGELAQPWFPDLLDRWRVFLNSTHRTESSTASLPIETVAATRILKAHRRLLKHGRSLPAKPTAAQFHRLRIDGKKLRYLLEFFGDLFDAERKRTLIQDLKNLQDVLGGINDREIQIQALDALASKISRQDPSLTTAIALHRHFLEQTLGGFRSDFGDQFNAFTNQAITQSFADLFEPCLAPRSKPSITGS